VVPSGSSFGVQPGRRALRVPGARSLRRCFAFVLPAGIAVLLPDTLRRIGLQRVLSGSGRRAARRLPLPTLRRYTRLDMLRYWIETYGCQMNKAESASLEVLFRERGWQASGGIEGADLVVLNTCSVRKTAENRVWGRLGALKHRKEGRSFKLAVMGCMSERLKEELLERAPHVDILVGNFQKNTFLDFLDEYMAEGEAEPAGRPGGSGKRLLLTAGGEYRFSRVHSVGGFQSYVPIMHGCNNFCSYCIVPYVRGREVSRRPQGILEELEELGRRGIREVTLLGQNVNSYRYEQEGRTVTFPGLLLQVRDLLGSRRTGGEEAAPGSGAVEWVRFLTSHPRDFSDELIEVLAGHPLFCRHVHLPVQHGSDRILAAMGRGYTRAQYLGLVERIRRRISNVSLTTDILIGFPGEQEEDFRLTLELMREVGFDDAFTYRYNPREGTKAFAMGDTVPEERKGERLEQVIELQRGISLERKRQKLGRRVRVLVEGMSRRSGRELLARAESDEMVVFPGSRERIGRFAEVELQSLRGNTFRGKEIG
jgi:tRNA-2-methylthio-N6-dimethylallyladenosine synthase